MSDHDDESPEMACLNCGLIFGMDDIDDFDDVHCPDCDSTSLIGRDEILE